MTLNNLSTIVPFGVHGYYVIDSMQEFPKPATPSSGHAGERRGPEAD